MRTCRVCGIEKDESLFYFRTWKNKNGTTNSGPQRRCKECTKKASATQKKGLSRDTYLAYQRKYSKTTGIIKKRKRFEWLDAVKQKPCEDCGNSFPPECMDFDHIDPMTKFTEVSRMAVSGYSQARVVAEIAKCRIICANCHRIRTARQQNRRKCG